MAFDYLWQGPPVPGSVPPNSIGLDTVDNVVYTSNGHTWQKVNTGTSTALTRYYPTQNPDGVLTAFTFAAAANSPSQFQLFWNGLLMNEGVSADYTISIGFNTTTVALYRAPDPGDAIIAYF